MIPVGLLTEGGTASVLGLLALHCLVTMEPLESPTRWKKPVSGSSMHMKR